MEIWQIVVVFVTVAVGAVVQGGAGFGLALVAAPVLLLIEPDLVPGPMIVGAAALTVAMTVREHQHLDLRPLAWAVAGRLPGTVLGALAVAGLSSAALDIGFGVLILALVALSLSGLHVEATRPAQFFAGALSGLSATATSVGGPPMALLHQHETGARLRANLSAYFTVGTVTSVVGLMAVGEFGWHELRLGLLLSVPVLAGFGVSSALARLLDRGHTRTAVLIISAVSSLSVLIRGLGEL